MHEITDHEDVTDLFLTYREATRHLWKTFFAPRQDEELPWLFVAIEHDLFYSLIVWELGKPTNQAAVSGAVPFGKGPTEPQTDFGIDPFPYLHVVPQIAPRGTSVIWLSDTRAGSIQESGVLHTSAIDLRFIDFDDTAMDAYSDWRYYRARVFSYPDDPTKEGSDMLIEVHNARIFFRDMTGE